MFYAYPSYPASVGATIENAIEELKKTDHNIFSWKELNISGNFIRDRVLEKIESSEILIADISSINSNVTFEIGYAIGKHKKLILTKNKSIKDDAITIQELGIFDTLGYFEYENSQQLQNFIKSNNFQKQKFEISHLNIKARVYLLETKEKTDDSSRITSRIKKARLMFRTFDPNESPRLSAHDAIIQVAQSFGVVVSILGNNSFNYLVHNIRASFIAGLSSGMDKKVCILQYGDSPIPLDFRDFVNIYYTIDEINVHIASFAEEVVEALQNSTFETTETDYSYLQKLDLGASAAENEMRTLEAYYLKTDAYLRCRRGESQLVVGRKGSGKSALFLQIRDKERSSQKNIVLDLKPEGYKLIKFKEVIHDYLEEGTFEHTISAFWEYLLLLELCYKILEKDKKIHMANPELYEPYLKLEQLYKNENYTSEGDFSERLSFLMQRFTDNFSSNYGENSKNRLKTHELTDLLYKNDINTLRDNLITYLKHKEKVWLLFDNIDKGWPSTGLKNEDLTIIRNLIDASRKIQRQFLRSRIEVFPIIFLRNDVYELLVKGTSDRQKESKVLLDWMDADLLREVVKLRIQASVDGEDSSDFDTLWRKICIAHIEGEETSQYLIERSLYRPRFLINLINQCKSYAINFNHKKIEKDDIEKGLSLFSTDLLTDISYELQDIHPETENILYQFIGCKSELSKLSLFKIVEDFDSENTKEIIDLLLWYGFLGFRISGHEIKYIYHFNYNMQILSGYIKKNDSGVIYCINPAFWPAPMIEI